MRLISRKEAKILGLTRYFTGVPCKRGHICARHTANTTCVECQRVRDSVVNPIWKRPDRKEKMRAYHAARQIEKKEELNKISRAWYADHREKGLARSLKWQKDNPDKARVRNAKRRASQLGATPAWLTDDQLLEIAALYLRAFDLGLEVDHIVPLQGVNACGLHVPWNLQLLTQKANRIKSNRLEV